MSLQSKNLVMVGLGVLADKPPNDLQPPLVDGIHLRWAFERELGFPWYGFYLFRRLHRKAKPLCISQVTSSLGEGPWPDTVLNLPGLGQLSSDRNLLLTNDFPPAGVVELHLDGRGYLRFTLPPGEPAYWVEVHLGFREDAKVQVSALSENTPVAQSTAVGKAGDTVTVALEFDAITAIEITPGPASLIEVCFIPVSRDATAGWETVQDFPYPLCLPATHPDYPCSGGAPMDPGAAEALALACVLYGPPNDWAGTPFNELHERLLELVEGGPNSTPMADRSKAVSGTPVPPDPGVTPPQMPNLYPLDLVLLGALHPAIAQMVGLYWADQTAKPDVAYDYLILADHSDHLGGNPDKALGWIQETGFGDVDGYIVFNKKMVPAPPLSAPDDLRVYALPGSSIRAQGGGLRDASNNAGMRWERGVTEFGVEVLLPGRALMYHLWRADLGDTEPTGAPSPDQYQLLTEKHPILVAEPRLPPGKTPERPPDWPTFPLHAIDTGLQEGWYSYQVNGVDIFGRHSSNSAAGSWYQWTPEPDPRPWYYKDPPANTSVHPFAVRLLDTAPPPPPTAIEAYALDPADPTVLRDAAYDAWRATLSPNEQATVIGLRVRWQWTEAHMRQAPDTHEFRIYYHPGTTPPTPDHSISTNWQERFYVVGFGEADHVTVTTDAAGRPLRKYEVFLPAPDDTVRDGLPLVPSLAAPIVYAHIGVSAADDKTHAPDDPKWDTGEWGGRFGNEGRLGAPAKIFRVWRVQPDPPVPPPDAERVYATAADYHSRSFYTYRWVPVTHLKTHIFRALDDAVFRVDWSQRPRPALDASQLEFFPDAATEPRWDALKRQQVADELNQLNSFSQDAAGTTQAMAYYRGLSNDGLRVLAGLAGNERAFAQVTIQPLDPDDPANANRVGPDNPPDFVVDPTLRAYVDTLDGRSANRYFYRAAYVDGAHNRSRLSLCSPPVWLPDVIPPAKPRLLKVLGGDRKVTLRWAADQGSGIQRYLVYRAENKAAGRDIRLMGEPVADLPAVPLVAAGGEVDLGTGTDVALVERVYAAEGFDPSADLLSGQSAVQYLATPTPPTGTRVTGLTAPDSTAVVVVYRDAQGGLQYTPWGNAPRVWTDEGLIGARTYYYRVVVTRKGETGSGPVILTSPASDLGAGRAVDLQPPDPPAWTRAEWVRIDKDGNEFPFSDPVPAGETREPAIALAWTSPEPGLASLVQQRRDNEIVFDNLTGWLPRGTTSYVVRGLWPHVRYRFRLYVLSQAGNQNEDFNVIRVNPVVVL